jgi:hypothetical protein
MGFNVLEGTGIVPVILGDDNARIHVLEKTYLMREFL